MAPTVFWPTRGQRPAAAQQRISVSPAGGAVPGDEPLRWAEQRSPERVADRMIHPRTQHWMQTLPAGLWPMHLASRYPRIANQLALAWPDRALSERSFAQVLADDRGGRQGFPREVAEELLRLRRHRLALGEAPAPGAAAASSRPAS
jgi:hypothetical protein